MLDEIHPQVWLRKDWHLQEFEELIRDIPPKHRWEHKREMVIVPCLSYKRGFVLLANMLEGVALSLRVGDGSARHILRDDDRNLFRHKEMWSMSQKTIITKPFCSLSFLLINSSTCYVENMVGIRDCCLRAGMWYWWELMLEHVAPLGALRHWSWFRHLFCELLGQRCRTHELRYRHGKRSDFPSIFAQCFLFDDKVSWNFRVQKGVLWVIDYVWMLGSAAIFVEKA